MAFLTPCFFKNALSIYDQTHMIIQSTDGEAEIQIHLPKHGRCHFMYQLWRSTEGGEGEEMQSTIEGFELSQFVMMEQREGFLHCRVRPL